MVLKEYSNVHSVHIQFKTVHIISNTIKIGYTIKSHILHHNNKKKNRTGASHNLDIM